MSDARPAASSAPALARAVDCVFLWPGYLAGVLYFVLAFFVTYDVLARNRYRWFGQLDACRVPTPDLRRRFLD